MDGDLIGEPLDWEARGWNVWVMHFPVVGLLPDVPKGWVPGMEKVLAERQVLVAWDPTRWSHPNQKEYGDPTLETVFSNATYRIKLRAK